MASARSAGAPRWALLPHFAGARAAPSPFASARSAPSPSWAPLPRFARATRCAALLLLASACGDDSMVDPPPPPSVGAIQVTWGFENTIGEARACDALRVVEVRVSAGGAPTSVACGDTMSVLFEQRTAGRYPIIVEAIGPTGLPSDALTFRGNVTVVAAQTAELHAQFVVDEAVLERGNLLVRWRIDGISTAEKCEQVDAVIVRLRAEPESVGTFEADVPCADGQVQLDAILRGRYAVRGTLLDSTGATVGNNVRVENALVSIGQTAMVTFNFSSAAPPLGGARLLAQWTVTGTTAAIGCNDVSGDYVRLRLEDAVINLPTSTAACDLGSMLVPRLPNAMGVRAFLELRDIFDVPITTSLVDMITLREATTTTISFDLDPGG